MNTRRNWRRGMMPLALAALALPAAGCDEVVTRGQFEGRLDALVSRLAAP